MTLRLISVDSHSDAPREVYLERLPAKYHDAVPYVQLDADGLEYIYVRDKRVMTMSPAPWGRGAGEWQKIREAEGRSGKWRPEDRLEHLDRDGVAAEVIQGGAIWVLMDPDADYQMAVCQAWNNWAMETYKPYQSRLQPSAVLPIRDIPASIKEVERLATLGYTNVQMPIYPVEKPYRSKDYDPLWEAIVAADLTINLHLRNGTRPSDPFKAGRVFNFVRDMMDGPIVALDLCSTGVFERNPKLKVVLGECGAGWVHWLLRAMDGSYEAHREWNIPLKMKPSEYFMQNIYCSVMLDTAAMKNIPYTGADYMVWSNDYPHPEGTWPESQRLVGKMLEESCMTEEQKAKFTHGNAERLFKFPTNTPSTSELLAQVKAAA